MGALGGGTVHILSGTYRFRNDMQFSENRVNGFSTNIASLAER